MGDPCTDVGTSFCGSALAYGLTKMGSRRLILFLSYADGAPILIQNE